MKGLIFVVWEKYLGEKFGGKFLDLYREAVGETQSNLPLTNRTYPDEMLMTGLNVAHKMTRLPEDTLMFEYGRYFLMNGLVEYLCGYLLAQSWTGYDLLLQMRGAHAQMRRTPDGLMPPLFNYEVLSNDHNHMILTYDSQRKLCSLLEGAIHGAAERFGEKAHTHQLSCMKKGDAVCRFEVRFEGESWAKRATATMIAQEQQRLSKQGLSNLILQVLPTESERSVSMNDLKVIVDQHQGQYVPEIYEDQRPLGKVHISQVYTALMKLLQVGLIASDANKQDDSFATRRYWRTSTTD